MKNTTPNQGILVRDVPNFEQYQHSWHQELYTNNFEM